MKMDNLEWNSVGAYMIYLDSAVGLTPICTSKIVSFKIGKGGIRGLLGKKKKLLWKVQRNCTLVSSYVAKRKEDGDPLGETEKIVLRSVYQQWAQYHDLLADHVNRLEALGQLEEKMAHNFLVDTEDGPPF